MNQLEALKKVLQDLNKHYPYENESGIIKLSLGRFMNAVTSLGAIIEQMEKQEQVIECDCSTSTSPCGSKKTECSSDQMRRAVEEGHAFTKSAQPQQPHHWIVPDYGFLFPTHEAAKRYLQNIDSKEKPIACFITAPAPAHPTPATDDLQPLQTIRYWLDAYSNPRGEEHFMGHGMMVKLVGEYLALREAHEKQATTSTQNSDETQPLALQIAHWIETSVAGSSWDKRILQAATELRRLHEENKRLKTSATGNQSAVINPLFIKEIIDQRNKALEMIRNLEEIIADQEYPTSLLEIGEGMKVVPVEPTKEMCNAAHTYGNQGGSLDPYFVYKAMLDAAPAQKGN